MLELKHEFLFDMELTIPPGYQLGGTPSGARIIAPFSGGWFKGKISGKILPGGGDWLVVRPDGAMVIDVRAILQAEDGSIIHAAYGGRIVIPPQLMEKAFNPETVGDIDPADYYFRSTPSFEVATDSPHAWLNGRVAVGVGRLMKDGGVGYKVYTIE